MDMLAEVIKIKEQNQTEKQWREDFLLYMIDSGQLKRHMKMPEYEPCIAAFYDERVQSLWEVYLEARRKSQEEIDGLKERNKSFEKQNIECHRAKNELRNLYREQLKPHDNTEALEALRRIETNFSVYFKEEREDIEKIRKTLEAKHLTDGKR